MCLHDHTSAPKPEGQLPRRGILAGAAALAGISVAGIAAQLASAPAALADNTQSAPNYQGRPLTTQALIIEGGTVVDPKTGDAVADGVVVLDGGKVAAVGTRDERARLLPPSRTVPANSTPRVNGSSQDSSMPTSTPTLWPMPAPSCKAVPPAYAAVRALSTRTLPSRPCRRGLLASHPG